MAFRNCLCLTNSWAVSDGPSFLLSSNSVPDRLMGCIVPSRARSFLISLSVLLPSLWVHRELILCLQKSLKGITISFNRTINCDRNGCQFIGIREGIVYK